MLQIHRASEPIAIETLILLLYGDPGAGKTSLAFTAEAPLLLDFDRGAHRSAFRKDTVPVDSWSSVEGMTAKDLEPYSTIEVDTVGRCLDLMALSIIDRDPKLGMATGGLTLQGYGALKAGFAAWMRKLRSFGKDVILIAHGDEKTSGDVLILRPEITGSSYGEVFKQADGVGYLRMVGRKRILEWDPQERSVGKNPAGLAADEVPDLATQPDYMAGLIAAIKASIGRISEEGQAVAQTVMSWREKVLAAATPKALTKLVTAINAELEGAVMQQVKALVAERARELDLEWIAEEKEFAPKAKEQLVPAES